MECRKIAFLDFWKGFDTDNNPLTSIIQEICDVKIVDIVDADYVFYSVFSNKHWFAKDGSIKIFITGEMVTPDFNACDYAIGYDWMTYGDRYLRLPLYYLFQNLEFIEKKHLCNIDEIIKKKTEFCSITVSNVHRDPVFLELFEELSKYKTIDSGGKWKNNVGGRVKDKFAFDLSHKFSIACENCSHPGYTTEKIAHAFNANCIPIYWGDPNIDKVFNTKAFLNVQDYGTIKEAVEEIIKLDTRPDLYKRMQLEPVYIDKQYTKEVQINHLKEFLCNILLQPIDQAYRRNRVCAGLKYIKDRRAEALMSKPYYFAKILKGKIL